MSEQKKDGAKGVAGEIAKLKKMSTAELREKYQEVFSEPTTSRNKPHLFRRIAHRMQEKAEGVTLSEKAKARAAELADESQVRVNAPRESRAAKKEPKARDPRLPAVGAVIEKEYKGKTLRVTVAEDGFEFEGEMHRSLSAVAKKATGGMSINGYLFFGLIKRPKAEAKGGDQAGKQTEAKADANETAKE